MECQLEEAAELAVDDTQVLELTGRLYDKQDLLNLVGSVNEFAYELSKASLAISVPHV